MQPTVDEATMATEAEAFVDGVFKWEEIAGGLPHRGPSSPWRREPPRPQDYANLGLRVSLWLRRWHRRHSAT